MTVNLTKRLTSWLFDLFEVAVVFLTGGLLDSQTSTMITLHGKARLGLA